MALDEVVYVSFYFLAFYLLDFSLLSPNIALSAEERYTSFEVFSYLVTFGTRKINFASRCHHAKEFLFVKVLIHDQDKNKVYDYGFLLHQQNPELEIYFFFTGEPVPEGVEVILGAI